MHVAFGDTTVLAGPNGAGKSNLLSALRLACTASTGSLRTVVAEAGGASRLLYYGPKTTGELELELVFDQERGENRYALRLGWASDDTLIFLDERVGHRKGREALTWTSLGAGHLEDRVQDLGTDTLDYGALTVTRYFDDVFWPVRSKPDTDIGVAASTAAAEAGYWRHKEKGQGILDGRSAGPGCAT